MTSVAARLHRAAWKPLYFFYYRFLFDRRDALSRAVGRGVARWEQRHARRDVPLPKELWECEYERGDWDFLGRGDDRRRYAWLCEQVAGLGERFGDLGPGLSVLDVGCGEGLLRRALDAVNSGFYVGVDLSERAVQRAREEEWPRAEFHVASAEVFEPVESFHAVVFNEVLCYFEDPIGEVERYARNLREGGLVLVSLFQSPRTRALTASLKRRFRVVDKSRLESSEGRWVLLALDLTGDAGGPLDGSAPDDGQLESGP